MPHQKNLCPKEREIASLANCLNTVLEKQGIQVISVECENLSYEELTKAPMGEYSSIIREWVIKACKIQEKRFLGIKGVHCNAQVTEKMIY